MNMTTKEKAVAKMEVELLEEHSEIEQALFDWLIEQEDEELFKGILEKEKSLVNARQYAYNQAFKIQVGGCAVVKKEDVYAWTADYFKTPMVVAKQGKLTKEKKVEKPKQKCENHVKKVEKAEENESKEELMKGEQLDLLDFL